MHFNSLTHMNKTCSLVGREKRIQNNQEENMQKKIASLLICFGKEPWDGVMHFNFLFLNGHISKSLTLLVLVIWELVNYSWLTLANCFIMFHHLSVSSINILLLSMSLQTNKILRISDQFVIVPSKDMWASIFTFLVAELELLYDKILLLQKFLQATLLD